MKTVVTKAFTTVALALGLFGGALGAQSPAPILIGVSGPSDGSRRPVRPGLEEGLRPRPRGDQRRRRHQGPAPAVRLHGYAERSQADHRRRSEVHRRPQDRPRHGRLQLHFLHGGERDIPARRASCSSASTTRTPPFPSGGDYIWSNSPNPDQARRRPTPPTSATSASRRSPSSSSTRTGASARATLTIAALKKSGVEVALREAYLPDEKDFRAIITKAKALGVDGIVLVSYANDAALLVQQIRGQGLTVPIVANGSNATADFPKLAGGGRRGRVRRGRFLRRRSAPRGQSPS